MPAFGTAEVELTSPELQARSHQPQTVSSAIQPAIIRQLGFNVKDGEKDVECPSLPTWLPILSPPEDRPRGLQNRSAQ